MPVQEGSLVPYSDSEESDTDNIETVYTNSVDFTQYYDMGEIRYIHSRTLKSRVLETKVIPKNIDIPIENPFDHVDLLENIIGAAVNAVLDLHRAT